MTTDPIKFFGTELMSLTKLKGIEGKIYILLQSIDRNGIIKDEPRPSTSHL